jgi:hypothetical protein
MKNTDWIFSEILQENFKIFYDKEFKKIEFSKGAIYSSAEIEIIKSLTVKKLKQIHIIKTVFEGHVRGIQDVKNRS